jgi:hypothetical protein
VKFLSAIDTANVGWIGSADVPMIDSLSQLVDTDPIGEYRDAEQRAYQAIRMYE